MYVAANSSALPPVSLAQERIKKAPKDTPKEILKTWEQELVDLELELGKYENKQLKHEPKRNKVPPIPSYYKCYTTDKLREPYTLYA